MSIATAINDLKGRIEDAYDSIEDMGGTVPTTKNSYNLTTAIESIPQGGGGGSEAEWKDVNFIDYDGKNLYSYTTQEALNLSALPELPNRSSEGLTCQEWNYTLEEVKANVNSCGKCTVGATYTTTDGKTHLFITIRDQAYRNVYLYFNQSNANGVVVDWGYGSNTYTDQTGNVSLVKSYPDGPYPMTYEIKMSCSNGTYQLGGAGNIFTGNSPSETTSNIAGRCGILDKVHIGQNCTGLNNSCFQSCRNLKAITIPREVVYFFASVFRYCSSLKSMVIPAHATGLTNAYVLSNSGIECISVPYSVSIGNYCFYQCQSLREIVFGNDVSFSGTYILGQMDTLNKAYGIIPQNQMFRQDYSLADVVFRNNQNIAIANSTFGNCYSLTTLSFPEVVTSIEENAFNGCYSLTLYDFTKATSIPTLANANAFTNTSTSKHIVVPNELYWDWVEATNWSTIATSIHMKYPSIGFKATVANSTIQLNKVGNPTDISLEYMYDGGEWTPYTIGDVLTLENVGDTVWVRKPDSNVQIFGNDESNYYQFSMTGQISAEGSISFLNTRNGGTLTLNSSRSYCYYKLFSGCSALVKAPMLQISSNANATSACSYMFEGCTGLTELPKGFGNSNTTVRSINLYKGMFKGCTGLTSVELPFTTLTETSTYSSMGCFDEMFMDCSNLNEIRLSGYVGNFDTDHFNDWVKGVSSTGTLWYNGSDTTVGDYAIPTGWDVEKILYDGFAVEARQANSTVSIVNESSAPTLSLQYSTDEGMSWNTFTVGSTTVTLANVGDRVCFRGTNTKWGGGNNNSRNRFSFTGQVAISGNINSLISSTDYNTLLDLSSGRDRLFQYLFYGNTALVDAENLVMPATRIGGWTYCNMFENCTNLAKAPKELPATYISSVNWAYSGMFINTAITKSPYIRITNVPNQVCSQLFDGCSNLAEIKMDYTGGFGTGAFSNWVNGVAATGTFYYNGSTTTRGASYIPTGWTITPFTA